MWGMSEDLIATLGVLLFCIIVVIYSTIKEVFNNKK